MIIGDRLRALREEKKLSQGDIEKRTGLLRCYISRVENGHTVPAIETLEKLARALECPLYQLFYDGEEPPQLPNLPKRKSSDDIAWGSVGKEARFLNKLRRLLSKAEEGDRKLVLYMAQKMAATALWQSLAAYSHSMVLGGFELISYTTLVTPGTSFTILVEMRSSTSPGNFTQSAVMASPDSTTRTATVRP